jgi:hypothetical protein
VKEVAPLLPPVFPALSYGSTASLGLRVHPESTPLSSLRFGVFSGSIASGLMRGLVSRSWEALAICLGLLQLPQELLRIALPRVAATMAREEVVRRLIGSAVARESNIDFAVRAIQCAMYCSQPDQVMVIVGNTDFLTRPNFPCVFVIFRYFIGRVSQPQYSPMMEFCKLLQRPSVPFFPDEFRRRVIQDLDSEENVAAVLHEFQFA